MTVLIFVRHGQATHNVTRAYWDPAERDAALTYEGTQQARDLRMERLAERCDAIWCSPLQRCRFTLSHMLGDMARIARIYIDDRLMEPQGSAIVNRRPEWAHLKASLPANWDVEHVSPINPFDIWVEGGTVGEEGHAIFDKRVRTWTEEVRRRWPNGRILVVTHHDWIASWFRQFGGGQRVSVDNAKWVTATLP